MNARDEKHYRPRRFTPDDKKKKRERKRSRRTEQSETPANGVSLSSASPQPQADFENKQNSVAFSSDNFDVDGFSPQPVAEKIEAMQEEHRNRRAEPVESEPSQAAPSADEEIIRLKIPPKAEVSSIPAPESKEKTPVPPVPTVPTVPTESSAETENSQDDETSRPVEAKAKRKDLSEIDEKGILKFVMVGDSELSPQEQTVRQKSPDKRSESTSIKVVVVESLENDDLDEEVDVQEKNQTEVNETENRTETNQSEESQPEEHTVDESIPQKSKQEETSMMENEKKINETPAAEQSSDQDATSEPADKKLVKEEADQPLSAPDVQAAAVLPTESGEGFDYIVPSDTYKQRKKHFHKSHHHSSHSSESTSSSDRKDLTDSDADYVFATPKKYKKRKSRRKSAFSKLSRWKKVLIIVISVLLALIIALGGTYFALHEIGRNSLKNGEVDIVLPTQDEVGNDIIPVDNTGRIITYDGVSYELNEDLISLTFIGVDDGNGSAAGMQMSDAIYILAIDVKTGKVKVLGVSRDTMTDVDLYSEEGSFIETKRMQMSFCYAYGNEKVTGGKNTNTSLKRLFFGLPFENYFAIDMDALITLNDAVGGVTLTSSMTFVSPEDGRTIAEGETVTLHGKEAERYVRSRDTSRLDSNINRMQRQQEYIRAFAQSIIPAVKSDVSVVSKLYSAITDNSDTTLDLPKITYMATTAATKLRNASDIEYLTLKGTVTEGEYAELNVSNQDAIRTMLDVFYKPLATIPESIQ